MNLVEAVYGLRPELQQGVSGFEVWTSPEGDEYIAVWDEVALGPEPSDEDLYRGWYQYQLRKKWGDLFSHQQQALMEIFPEARAVAQLQTSQDLKIIYGSLMALFRALADVIASNLAPADQATFAEVQTKMDNAGVQLNAMHPTSIPEYQSAVDELSSMSWETL